MPVLIFHNTMAWIPVKFSQKVLFILVKAWFPLCRNVNNQRNTYRCSGSPNTVHEVPLPDLKVRVWCAMSAQKIIGNMFFKKNSKF
jgi:hypothetical protein